MKQYKEVTVVEKITQEIATQYLSGKCHNRPLNNDHVEFLAGEKFPKIK